MFYDAKEKEWLNGLAVGSKVFISMPYNCPPQAGEVVRLTKTQVIAKRANGVGRFYETRFNKGSGEVVGGGPWTLTHLVMPSPKIREEVEMYNLVRKAILLRDQLNIPKDKQLLLELIRFLEGFNAKNKG